jgi:hypothetical protein
MAFVPSKRRAGRVAVLDAPRRPVASRAGRVHETSH